MDLLARKRNKRKQNNVTYADDVVAQPYASYQRVPVVTKSGAIKHQRIEQNLAPTPPVGSVTNDVDDVEASQQVDELPATQTIPDDVLAGVEIPRNYKPRKVCSRFPRACRQATTDNRRRLTIFDNSPPERRICWTLC